MHSQWQIIHHYSICLSHSCICSLCNCKTLRAHSFDYSRYSKLSGGSRHINFGSTPGNWSKDLLAFKKSLKSSMDYKCSLRKMQNGQQSSLKSTRGAFCFSFLFANLSIVLQQQFRIQVLMGNIQNLCEPQLDHQNTLSQNKGIDMILKNRVQVKEVLPVPNSASKKICELIGCNNIQDIWQESKIWKVEKPCKFFYINEPSNKDNFPTGICTIFTFGNKNEFESFRKGCVDNNLVLQTQGSVSYYSNGDYFLGDPIKKQFGKYINEIESYQYEGDFLNGKPHGLGKQKMNNYIYQGYFFHGVKQGKGKVWFQNGLVCEGEFIKNETNGRAKLTNKQNQYLFDGQFKHGQKSGQGKQKTSQYIYQGNFENNKKNGKGKINYVKQNWFYEGFFKQDQPHGRGMLVKNETVVKGIWNNGRLIALQN